MVLFESVPRKTFYFIIVNTSIVVRGKTLPTTACKESLDDRFLPQHQKLGHHWPGGGPQRCDIITVF